jgi:hypothetical protein
MAARQAIRSFDYAAIAAKLPQQVKADFAKLVSTSSSLKERYGHRYVYGGHQGQEINVLLRHLSRVSASCGLPDTPRSMLLTVLWRIRIRDC